MKIELLGNNIAKILKEKNMTIGELAEKVNVGETILTKYIKGERVIKGPLICKIAKVLDTDVGLLLGEEPKKPEYTLKEYTKEEYEADIKKALAENGLYSVVESICDEINEETKGLPYLPHRDIQECLCGILDTIKLNEEGKSV